MLTPWRTNRLFKVLRWTGGDSAAFADSDRDTSKDVEETGDINAADIVSSEVRSVDGLIGKHMVMIDVDIPVTVVESSTPGHSHVYIESYLSWGDYKILLEALSDAGIIERGYFEASRARGFTALRLPWVHKDGS